MFKGIDDENIFYDNKDRNFFLKHLKITKKEFNYQIFAYCLMGNHVHIVLRCEDLALSKGMQSLLIKYAHYFNAKYNRKGPFIQNRFKSKTVENQRYFLEVCRYVHRNPENAKISKTNEYPWSSYQEYLGKEKIIDKKILLHYFNNNLNDFIRYTNKIIQDANDFIEYEFIDKLTDEQLVEILIRKFNLKDISEISKMLKFKEKEELKKIFEEIKYIKGTNITQVSRVTRIGRKRLKSIWEEI